MKKLFAIAVLVLILILALQLVSLACLPPPPPGATCSPGFWKNHAELWPIDYNQDLMDDLTARGPGSEELRYAAADLLNSISPIDYCGVMTP